MLLFSLLFTVDTLARFMQPGVSIDLAEYRARTLSDVRYELALDLTSPDSAVGRVRVRVRRSAGAGDLILDYRGPRVSAIEANGREVSVGVWNGSHLRVPEALLADGENEIRFEFASAIAPSGASIIRFHDDGDGSDFLYTLLVPADANQLFPCFDQPDLKARVALTLRMPVAWTAVANGPEIAADTSNGTVTRRFAVTRPLSTYLVAFAAGPWLRESSTYRGRTINAYVRPSRAAEADLDSLLLANHRALEWMEEYFGRPYPFAKYDFVLAPAFPFGGMEHPGAVFYTESGFIFRERPPEPRRLGRLATIFHEVAHQWFGDLVTMRWFDDLWLKEGFATYMAAKALATLEPRSDAWKTFYLRNKPSAYGIDQTAGTTPVWQRLDNLDQAKSNYGAIVYNKAPSVLKQLEFHVGSDPFQQGVRTFLDRFEYGNATWRDLLETIGHAAGRPLDDWGRHYILRPGMPELEPRVVTSNGRLTRLELAQRPAQGLSGAGAWPIRTRVLLAFADREWQVLDAGLDDASTVVELPPGLPAPTFVFANYADQAYALTLLDTASTRQLRGGELRRIEDQFLRTMLWGALWDQVRAARLQPEAFVELALDELPRETDEQLMPVQVGRLVRAVDAYLVPPARNALLPRIERALWDGAADPRRGYGLRKAQLDAFIEVATGPDAMDRLRRLLEADSVAGEPMRDPTRWTIVARLTTLGADVGGRALAAQTRRDTTPEGRRSAFAAGAARLDPDAKRDYFERYFADSTLNEDWASASLGAFNAVEHQAITRPYLVRALDSLSFIQGNRRIFFLGSWLGAFVGGQTEPEALEIVRGYLGDHPDLAIDLRRKVLQYVDDLERTVRIRSRWSPASGAGR